MRWVLWLILGIVCVCGSEKIHSRYQVKCPKSKKSPNHPAVTHAMAQQRRDYLTFVATFVFPSSSQQSVLSMWWLSAKKEVSLSASVYNSILDKQRSSHLSKPNMVREGSDYHRIQQLTGSMNADFCFFNIHFHSCLWWSIFFFVFPTFPLCILMCNSAQLRREKAYRTLLQSEPWCALTVMFSILVTLSLTWWGSSTHSKPFCFGQRRPCSPSGQYTCSLKERHPVWRRQGHCATLMYVVVGVRCCSYFVVRQMRYEVLADFLNCRNLKNYAFVLKTKCTGN